MVQIKVAAHWGDHFSIRGVKDMIIDPLSQMLDRFTHIKRSVTALHQIDHPFCIAIREKTWSENLPIGKRVEGSLSIPGAHVTGSTCKNGL